MKNKFLNYWYFVLRMLKPPRSLRFTKLGTYVVILTIGIGLAAMNTGNNLLYMVFGMMLGFITASGIISEMSLRGLELDWILPAEIYAEKLTTIRLILKNDKHKFPSFGITVRFAIKQKRKPIEKPVQSNFMFVPAQSQKCFDIKFEPERRGQYLIEKLIIETLFPFGFFKKYMTRIVEKSFAVYPRIDPIKSLELHQNRHEQEQTLPFKGWGDSFWGIRNFLEGDNPRQISWKNSAKQTRLMVRETEKETEKRVLVSLGPLKLWRELREEELESAISFAASFIYEKFNGRFAVGFMSQDLFFVPSISRKNVSEMFNYLALFDPQRIGEESDRWKVKDKRSEREEEIVEILSLWKKYTFFLPSILH